MSETIASAAAAAAAELTQITEPFEKLIGALHRLAATPIPGSDEQVRILNQTAAPVLHRMARELRADRRFKKLRSLATNCRLALQPMLETIAAMETSMRVAQK